ncbi:unannotated protein [freshwater metagenome]|uniref:Unannotated protein n=1 Tax=freshwater metagenome TaxID=449393 RepID=A0A6J7P6J4_9ZZZZ
MWIIDLNRQSLDRVVPTVGVPRMQGMFEAAGWQVITVKYGRLLEGLFERSGGESLCRRIDDMTNPEYQRLLRCSAQELRDRLPGTGPEAQQIGTLLATLTDDELLAAIRNLGGHDHVALDAALSSIDDTRPTVILAYTVKGFGLATEGHPQNHSSLLTVEQMQELAERSGMTLDAPWQHFDPAGEPGRLCAAVASQLQRDPVPVAPDVHVPEDLGRTPQGMANTQAALGRALLDLNRAAPEAGSRIVTLSPDVSSSTNLGGWINKVGVWASGERDDWFADDGETLLHWREHPHGQHMELGIAEVNLVSALGEFGATWSRWGQPLLPIGVMYDPFVERALEPWTFGMYAGGQSLMVGTPSGVTLSGEGGAHQSITTPSIGLEKPGCITYEPAFVIDTEWAVLAILGQMGRPGGQSGYLRLSTRPIDQKLAAVPADPVARERRRRHSMAGAYLLRRSDAANVTIAAMGAMVPEALAAADRLDELGHTADVLVVTSPGLLFRALQARRGLDEAPDWILESVLPAHKPTPLVTVLDGHPHTLAFLATVNGVKAAHLGVTRFGQAGDLASVYRYHGIDAEAVASAALDLLE